MIREDTEEHLNAWTKKGLRYSRNPLQLLAGSMGLEPTASGVTGRRYNRLNYDPAKMVGGTGLEPVTSTV